jgi:hypothetical protein
LAKAEVLTGERREEQGERDPNESWLVDRHAKACTPNPGVPRYIQKGFDGRERRSVSRL